MSDLPDGEALETLRAHFGGQKLGLSTSSAVAALALIEQRLVEYARVAEAAKPFAVVSGRADANVNDGYALISALDALDSSSEGGKP